MLQDQHRQLDRLFDELEATRDQHKKEGAFAELAGALLVHSNLEEKIFYPACEDVAGRPYLLESAEEHLSMKRLLADMVDLDVMNEIFDAKAAALKEQVQIHNAREERVLFPMAKKAMDREQLIGLAKEMSSLMFELQEQEPAEVLPAQISEAAHI